MTEDVQGGTRKDWVLTAALGAVGIVMVAGAMTGWYGPAVEVAVWTLIGILWCVAAVRFAARPVRVVIGAGLASGVFAGLMQAAFLSVLVARNAAWAGQGTAPLDRLGAFASALVMGIVWGLLFGGILWIVRRVQARRVQTPEEGVALK